MAGKYAKFRGKVKPFEEDPLYQAKVEAWKQHFIGENPDSGNVAWLGRQFATFKSTKKELEDQVKEVNLYITGLNQILTEHLEGTETQKLELISGELLYIQDTPYPKVVDQDKWHDHCVKHKLLNLFTMPWMTMKSMVSELLVKGQALPDGVEVFLKTEIRLRGGKGGSDE
jgi:hypothetical protein